MKKNILITGSSSGIGKVVAEHLSGLGHTVIGTSRNAATTNPKFDTITVDVTNDDSVARGIKSAIAKLGKIDVLINNAGYGIYGPIETTTHREAMEQFDVNYFGVLRVTNGVINHMKENGGGLIIIVSSMGGLIGLPFQGHYSASKFALEGMAEALRMELKPFNITVTNINPADFKTPFTANRKHISIIPDEYKQKFDRFLQMYEKDENNGSDPIIIAKLVERLINKGKNLNVRYITGKSSQTIAPGLKRILGAGLFEKLLQRLWGV